jgi:eukaryotic-like serine/threonine-protein kinase
MSGAVVLLGKLGAGGMASVHLARLTGPLGFERIVAVKRLLPALAADPSFVAMLIDEARVSAMVRHVGVVPVLDLRIEGDELSLVLEYVHGASLAALAQSHRGPWPAGLVVALAIDVLQGLHAAHQTRGADRRSLGVVHRDVSPQNILLGVDGQARLTDFGIARACSRLQTTAEGQHKGKLGYMAPEQLLGARVDARTDVYALGVVLWELLAGQRLFDSAEPGHALARATRPRPDSIPCEGLSAELEAIVLRSLEPAPGARFPSAGAMADALEELSLSWPRGKVSSWVESVAAARLEELEEMLEGGQATTRPPLATPPAAPPGLAGLGDPDATTGGLAQPRGGSPWKPIEPSPATPATPPATGALRGALVLLASAVAIATLLWLRDAGSSVVSRRPLAEQPAGELAAQSVATDASVVPAVLALPSTGPAPSATVPLVAPSSPRGELPTSPRPGPRYAPPGKRAAPSATRDHCSPPYVTDAEGVRAYKPECL